MVSRLKRVPLIYDSHELFCDVPELLKTPIKRKIWQRLESFLVPKLKTCVTVNDSIAGILKERHGVPFVSVRNIPAFEGEPEIADRASLELPANKKILLLQGAGINIDRGAEELVEAMQSVEGALLLIIGSGDCWPLLEAMVRRSHLHEKVKLIPKIPRQKLLQYTRCADLGLSIDKNTNPNYYYSLPNKLFDYIHCGVPVLVSRLPEIERIVRAYNIGEFIEDHSPPHLSKKITELIHSPQLETYRRNTHKAIELNWESEKQKLMALIPAP